MTNKLDKIKPLPISMSKELADYLNERDKFVGCFINCFLVDENTNLRIMKNFVNKVLEIGAGHDRSVSLTEEEEWIKEAEKLYEKCFPTDKEVEKWFDENIGYDKEKPCSASSAIYKFRLWLKERK